MADDVEDARLAQLIETVLAGRARVSVDDTIAIATRLNQTIDEGTVERAAVGVRQGVPVVCSRGCNGCCEEPVMVWMPEAQVVARWLMDPAQLTVRTRFLAAFPAWQKAAGDGPRRLAELGGRVSHDAYLAEHQAQWGKRVMCAFNHEGDCAIYPVRPPACRNGHAVGTSARCSGANYGGRPASRLEYTPLDDFIARADAVLHAMHVAAGGDRRRAMALCEAVHRLLQSAMSTERKAQRRR